MDIKLYKQAKQNIQKQREQELREEIQEDVKEEYERLKFESEKVIADEAILAKIKILHQKCSKLSAIQMYDQPRIDHRADILEMYLKTKRYHPRELKELEAFVKRRLELKKKK
ncbi:hypothetical protein J4210_01870 [Candidatus Woesearchaeota archaeon]|nr:hypothetical protein [Candidatus Woesearchaeota archaeon]